MTLRRYLIAGLLVWLPLGVTVLVIRLLVNFMDQTLLLIPHNYRPEVVFGVNIPGLGIVLAAAIVLLTGALAANFFGRQMVSAWERLMARIPFIRTIYTGVKQITETVVSSNNKSFREVLLIEYPRKGIWTLAFHTGSVVSEVQNKTGVDVMSVFVPTTPNPTSGFFIMVPRAEVIVLSMTIDEAVKIIMSLGVIVPGRMADKTAGGTPDIEVRDLQ
ncbi:MAG: DUF502 domain-containing protein [Gammaproteobacteria bacterium]|nr:DUF502 domain-containing protein [Gammaproteobacteria bacterium]